MTIGVWLMSIRVESTSINIRVKNLTLPALYINIAGVCFNLTPTLDVKYLRLFIYVFF